MRSEELIQEMREVYSVLTKLQQSLADNTAEREELMENKSRTKEEGQRMKQLEGIITSQIYLVQGRRKDLAEKKAQVIEALLGEM